MEPTEQQLPIKISWYDVLITSIVSWMFKKLLDFIFERAKHSFIRSINLLDLLRDTGVSLMNFALDVWGEDLPYFYKIEPITRGVLNGLVEVHEQRHKKDFIDPTTCKVCQLITKHKTGFKQIFPERILFPPFS